MKSHILGIAGSMSTPLAVALLKLGHQVTGSDQEKIYPPFSDILSENKITVNQTTIDSSIDLIITNGAFDIFERTKLEYAQAQKIGIACLSGTEYIAKYLVKAESIIVCGSYGKTTITALLIWAFEQQKHSPSYFVAGQFVDELPSSQISTSRYSIVEAGEDFHGLETKAKFLYYPTKYVILTSARWEHKDCYKTESDNLLAYQTLVQNIPQDGVLIYNPHDHDIQKILPFCKSKKIPYETKHFETKLIGEHNQQNISAAFTLCQYLNIPFDITQFSGVKRRLEIVSTKKNILIIDDFAQSSHRVLAAIKAVNYSYPHRRLFIYFEPHASFLQNKQSLTDFNLITPLVEKFILSKIKFSPDKSIRATAADWQQQLADKLVYLPINQNIIDFFISSLSPNDILIHFSSGGLDGLNSLKTVYNSI